MIAYICLQILLYSNPFRIPNIENIKIMHRLRLDQSYSFNPNQIGNKKYITQKRETNTNNDEITKRLKTYVKITYLTKIYYQSCFGQNKYFRIINFFRN